MGKSLFDQLIGWDVGQSPNIVSVPLQLGQLATAHKRKSKSPLGRPKGAKTACCHHQSTH